MFLAAAWIALNGLSGFWVKKQIEKKIGAPVSGVYVPVLVWPRFYLKNVGFVWKSRVELLKGDLRVDYSLLPLAAGRIAVRLKGKGIEVRLLDDWARMQGVEGAVLDRFKADLEFGRRGIEEIHQLEAVSPAFQFQIKKSEN